MQAIRQIMSSFASLNAGMLARGAKARPSAEPPARPCAAHANYRPAGAGGLEAQEEFDAGDASA